MNTRTERYPVCYEDLLSASALSYPGVIAGVLNKWQEQRKASNGKSPLDGQVYVVFEHHKLYADCFLVWVNPQGKDKVICRFPYTEARRWCTGQKLTRA